jgi:Family of unknown function (DUF5683)
MNQPIHVQKKCLLEAIALRMFVLMMACLLVTTMRAQTDSLKIGVQNDVAKTSQPKKELLIRNPKKAAIMSACLPGLGQAYNKKYWKMPIIYAGFAGLGYGFYFNNKFYKKYRNGLRFRYDNDSTTLDPYPNFSDDNLVTLKNYYQRYRDLCVIGAAALYTLNIIDAVVDAHLSSFDVSDDLTIQLRPGLFITQRTASPTLGIGFRF